MGVMSGLRDALRACGRVFAGGHKPALEDRTRKRNLAVAELALRLAAVLEERDELLAALSATTEECERLKCCDNCGGSGYHFGAFGCFPAVSPLFVDTNPADRCHFTPSQWTPRQEATP